MKLQYIMEISTTRPVANSAPDFFGSRHSRISITAGRTGAGVRHWDTRPHGIHGGRINRRIMHWEGGEIGVGTSPEAPKQKEMWILDQAGRHIQRPDTGSRDSWPDVDQEGIKGLTDVDHARSDTGHVRSATGHRRSDTGHGSEKEASRRTDSVR